MIEFKKVSKVYPNGTKGLIDVDLKIEQGEFVAIIGLSGSGKSTLIRCVNKMHEITSGELIVNDVDVKKLSGSDIRKFRRKIGMIFQSFNLVTRTTVIKNVLAAFVPDLTGFRKFFGIFPKECKIKSLEALDKVDMLEKAYVRVDQLSGGQQQRVALARALGQNPQIILADEPTGALDSQSGQNVMEILRQLHAEGHTIIMVTHDREIAASADRVITVADGRIA